MIRRHTVLLVALFMVAALWVGSRTNGLSVTRLAQAQATKSPEARKWEYCTIISFSSDSKRQSSSATVGFLTTTGTRLETLDGGSTRDPFSIAFAKLGSEGWECVGQGRTDMWLFKRPVP
jgi:hypothetical protein